MADLYRNKFLFYNLIVGELKIESQMFLLKIPKDTDQLIHNAKHVKVKLKFCKISYFQKYCVYTFVIIFSSQLPSRI